jgi:hypothetical protein
MSTNRSFATLAVLLSTCLPGWCAEPLTLELQEQVGIGTALVNIGDVARISGGTALTRDRVARLDIGELRPRDQSVAIPARVIKYRLQVAGIDTEGVVVKGSEQVSVTISRRTVTADEVVTAARAELSRRVPPGFDTGTIELIQQVVVQLPEVPVGDPITITAAPHSRIMALGRVQMDVQISSREEKLLALPVYFELKGPATTSGTTPAVATPGPVQQAGGVGPIVKPVPNMPLPGLSSGGMQAPALLRNPVMNQPATQAGQNIPKTPGEIVITPRERVTMLVRTGALSVTTALPTKSALNGTIPWRRASSRRRGVGSSVFDS